MMNKQRLALLFIIGLLVLLFILLRNVGKKQEIRPRAAGSGEVDLRFEPSSGTRAKNDTFKVDLKLFKTAARGINASGAQAVINIDSKFTINSATCEAPFNGLPVANISGQTVTFICGIALGTNPVALDATGKSFASVNVTVKSDAADGAASISFSSTRVTEAGVGGQAPDVSTGGQNASFTVGGVGVSPTPSPTGNPSACLTFPTTDTFDGATINGDLWEVVGLGGSDNASVSQSGGLLRVSTNGGGTFDHYPGVKSKKTICGDFDVRVDFSQFSHGQGSGTNANLRLFASSGNSTVFINLSNNSQSQFISSNIALNGNWGPGDSTPATVTSGKLRIVRRANIFTVYYDTGSGWQLHKTYTNGFNNDVNAFIEVGSIAPDRPAISTNFDNFYLAAVQPDPTFTPVPSRTPTPSISPTPLPPTPPSGQDKYTIDVGDKQYLVFNIAPGQTPQIRFKAKLANTQNNPQLYFRLRVKDELAFLTDPNADSSSDICNSPPPSVKDFAVPMQATDGVYSPVPDIGGPPPVGQTKANVDADGWVLLPGVIAGKYYSIVLKAPKTSGEKMVEHALLQPDKNDSQDFDWTANEINPGDLPDPNNGLKQDCTVNSVDLSLITSRLGATDGDSLNIGDVNYDGVINGNDVSKVVNTLSTKPDDDL